MGKVSVVTTNQFEILTDSGWREFDGLRKTKRNQSIQIECSDGKQLHCTPEHKIRLKNGLWKEASNLTVNDSLDEHCVITNVNEVFGRFYFFDALEVKNGNKYLTNGIVSHNCNFIGSSDTLISPDVLAILTFENPIRQTEKVSIYEEPIPGHIYFIGVDVARGVGGDFSAFLVIDITQAPYKVVASFRDNNIAPIVYPTVIHYAANIYNNAFILVETNDVGLEIADTLNFELENENVLMTTLSGKNGQVLGEFGAQSRFGFRTTPATKRIGCFALKGLVENQQIILNDFELVSELTNFVSDGKNYSAEEGKHDDMVMCLVMFAWATNQTYFKDLVDADIRKVILDKRRQLLEEDMMPFGIFDNHVDPEPLSQEEVIEKDRAAWMI